MAIFLSLIGFRIPFKVTSKGMDESAIGLLVKILGIGLISLKGVLNLICERNIAKSFPSTKKSSKKIWVKEREYSIQKSIGKV